MSYPFYSERLVKRGRRKRRCDWCGEVIEPLTSLYSYAGYYEDFYNGHLHPECKFARSHVVTDEWYPREHARGRIDDSRGLPPQFNECGDRISV